MINFKKLELRHKEAFLKMMQDFYAIDNYPINLEKTENLYDEFISNENLGQGFLIEYEDEIAGYFLLTYVFSFEYGGRIAFLDELFIDEKFRGKKIASTTLDFIQKQKELLDIKIMYLEVEPHNLRAQKLYEKHLFTKHNRWLMIKK